MTERKIQNAIWSNRGRQSALMCPNYTPAGWWECDVWATTKAGYGVEFEIKVSLSDFRADTKKESGNKWVRDQTASSGWRQNGNEKKHDLLACHDERGPSRFFYVVPLELGLKPEDMPTWAGLITAEPHFYWDGKMKRDSGTLYLRQEKEAPKLHGKKVDVKIIEHCRSVFFWRYWNLRTRPKYDKILTEGAEGAESPQITGDLPQTF